MYQYVYWLYYLYTIDILSILYYLHFIGQARDALWQISWSTAGLRSQKMQPVISWCTVGQKKSSHHASTLNLYEFIMYMHVVRFCEIPQYSKALARSARQSWHVETKQSHWCCFVDHAALPRTGKHQTKHQTWKYIGTNPNQRVLNCKPISVNFSKAAACTCIEVLTFVPSSVDWRSKLVLNSSHKSRCFDYTRST